MLAFSLDSIDDFYRGNLIYQRRRPTVTNDLPARVAAPPPAETCYGCNQDFYSHELCETCGACHNCCFCAPAQTDDVELVDDPEYLDWLHLLDRADERWDTRGERK